MVGAVEEAWVDVRVEEAGDGEDGGEDGDDGGEGEREGSGVVVNDPAISISTLYLMAFVGLTGGCSRNVHSDGKQQRADLQRNWSVDDWNERSHHGKSHDQIHKSKADHLESADE